MVEIQDKGIGQLAKLILTLVHAFPTSELIVRAYEFYTYHTHDINICHEYVVCTEL